MNRTLRHATAAGAAATVPRRLPAVVRLSAALVIAAAGLLTVVVASPAQAAAVSQPLRTMVANLPVATEVRTGYDRDLFNHWIDADGDGCNTRYEVLIAEATTAPSVGSGCALSGGRWTSYFDGAGWTDPADLDIDHLVPLAEAWDSGARTWSSSQRQSFANDIGDARSLAAVTDNVNQSKGDQDPAEWLPSVTGVHCRYLTEWTAVKTRWGLTVDTTEKSRLTSIAAGCTNSTVTVDVVIGAGPTTTATRTATASPTGGAATCTGTNATDVTVPDAGSPVTSTITISGCSRPAASSGSTVYVNVVHPFRGDVSVYLYAPDNSYYVLKAASSSDGAANVNATYTVNLSAETANGAWRLSVKDNAAGDTGYLNTWTLTV
ncbi:MULTISPECIES: proprotein convertase P-domain-containing protein [Catenuloplanes]|uniref:Molybdopterin-binding protein n=1 Tax=Catenuloplanes niger TaxID=587534 RepID=A0AAE4CRM0_9ACTN|nr:proprotein convertase P-domain-containing protein [Catenuloplanes niger]MDR7320278.1 molybdopterin-binding protein [Catenuloplanes niger]